MRRFILIVFIAMSLSSTQGQIRDERQVNQAWETDTSKHQVPLSEFRVLLPRDGIPPIDQPTFLEAEDGAAQYFAHEPVIVVAEGRVAKAYPLNILTYHEIVNDSVGARPVTVTYCPLCNAAIVFDRRLEFQGKHYLLDFGVSGMLRNSDLVMWDRQTESWWQQFSGEGLVGKLMGAKLEWVSTQILSVEEFYAAYPQGLILSPETGHARQQAMYGQNAYVGYDSLGRQPRLFEGKVDERLPAMERIINVGVGAHQRAYPLTLLRQKHVLHDTLGGQRVVLFHREGTRSILDSRDIRTGRKLGTVTVFQAQIEGQALHFRPKGKLFKDQETGSLWDITGYCREGAWQGRQLRKYPYGQHFAFAWFAFYPESELYQK